MALVASRHRLQRWGSYVSHIAIVVILLGAMMKNLLGFETFLPILEGRSSNVTQSLFDALGPDVEDHFALGHRVDADDLALGCVDAGCDDRVDRQADTSWPNPPTRKR